MGDNPLEIIAEAYDQSVKKIDENGFSEKFKQATEALLDDCGLWGDDITSTIEEITYLDGYFIFAHGTNSVVHFKVKECPGWLFGIWWDEPSKENSSVINGQFFAQYEDNIDKFKPSASNISVGVSCTISNEQVFVNNYMVFRIIGFIRDEPYLAFCRDYCGWDYNTEFHSREEAKEEFERYSAWKSNERKYTEICDNRLHEFVANRILPQFSNSVLEDDHFGDFDVIAPFEMNKQYANEPGFYSWFGDDDDSEWQEIKREYDQLIDGCKKLSEEHHFYWHQKITPYILLYKSTEDGEQNDER